MTARAYRRSSLGSAAVQNRHERDEETSRSILSRAGSREHEADVVMVDPSDLHSECLCGWGARGRRARAAGRSRTDTRPRRWPTDRRPDRRGHLRFGCLGNPRSVSLIDSDPQASAADWIENSPDDRLHEVNVIEASTDRPLAKALDRVGDDDGAVVGHAAGARADGHKALGRATVAGSRPESAGSRPPSAIQVSAPTPWCTENSPPGS
jgi:hypothetical protein